jgi:DNA-binding PadR family transcriptional regulator
MSPGSRPLSPTTLAVVRALAAGYRYGFDVMDATALPSGTVYPILGRLERTGLVTASWEDPEAHREEGRPARKYYDLTAAGRVALAEQAAEAAGEGDVAPGYSVG